MQEEQPIPDHTKITIEQILKLDQPTKQHLCPLEANIYGIQFVHFKIRNAETNQVLFEITKPKEEIGKVQKPTVLPPPRFVKYHFGPNFFLLKTLGTTLTFSNGPKPLKDFLMIERHYFKGKLIKSYEFEIPFCIPNTTNSLQAVYELPNFAPQMQKDMIDCPFETVSDSFYFAGGSLIMHNKAAYSYAPFSL